MLVKFILYALFEEAILMKLIEFDCQNFKGVKNQHKTIRQYYVVEIVRPTTTTLCGI